MNILTKAVESRDMDEALGIIMDRLEIRTGDVAGQVLGPFAEVWRDADRWTRARLIKSWLEAELTYAVIREPTPSTLFKYPGLG